MSNPSIFEEEVLNPMVLGSKSTKDLAKQVATKADSLALGGGVVRAYIEPGFDAPTLSPHQAWTLHLANGQTANVAALWGFLQNAENNPNLLATLVKEYSTPSSNGPAGVSWQCSETDWRAIQQKAVDCGLVPLGGGVIGDSGSKIADIEAIGNWNKLPGAPQGFAKQHFVIAFTPPSSDYEAIVCNAAFLGHMIDVAGKDGALAFAKARTVAKGWRAS